MVHIMPEDCQNLGHHRLLKNMVKLRLQAFCRTLNMEKSKNLVSVYKTFKNILLLNYLTEFVDIAHKWSLDMCYQSLPKW